MPVYENTDKQTYIAEIYDGETGLMQFMTSDLFCFAHLLDMLHGLGCEQKRVTTDFSLMRDSNKYITKTKNVIAIIEMQPLAAFDFDNIVNSVAAKFDPEMLRSGLFIRH